MTIEEARKQFPLATIPDDAEEVRHYVVHSIIFENGAKYNLETPILEYKDAKGKYVKIQVGEKRKLRRPSL